MTTSAVRSACLRAVAVHCCFSLTGLAADPALTIYNQDFAVVRETVPLQLTAGPNTVQFSGATFHLEPDSVILRDPASKQPLLILEQNYRADPVSQGLLLNIYEGQTIQFMVPSDGGQPRLISGKIIRSGYVGSGGSSQFNQVTSGQPIIEVNGKLQFSLPGQPIFPSLGDDTILKPRLDWLIQSPQSAKFDAELSYVTGGMSWNADYNLVLPENGDSLDVVGWVTLQNQSGKQFDHAHIKLMAGDVNKLQARSLTLDRTDGSHLGTGTMPLPEVTERTFDEYHLYTLPLPTTLHDRETKQVEFMHASNVSSRRRYIYDGLGIDRNRYGGDGDFRMQPVVFFESNPHVWIMREFANSEANHLGLPLPKGRVRFYRRDQGGQLEFTGENTIDHTAKDEVVKIYSGNAFDIAGEHRQTQFSASPRSTDESFEIKLRNHKKEAATVTVVEHLYRWSNWSISQESDPHRQTDSRTIEYEVTLQPGQEKVITYTAHYYW